MKEFVNNRPNKLRLAGAGVFVTGSLIFLLILPSLILTNPKAHAAVSKPVVSAKDPGTNGSPNVITEELFNSAGGIQKAVSSTQSAVYNSSRIIRNSIASATAASAHFIAHGVASTAIFTVHASYGYGRFLGHIASDGFAVAFSITKIGSVIAPAKDYSASVPTIDPQSIIPANSQDAPPIIATAAVQIVSKPLISTAPQWPINGEVTLEFGVPHWPFQPTHTGMDISDGKPQGITPIHPFEPGIVVQAVHSSFGFGNHVIIDHGGGITSLYGHMYSIAVQVGQRVDESTILGTEGDTGASEGVHVHFEIDVNGIPENPRKFVSGQP